MRRVNYKCSFEEFEEFIKTSFVSSGGWSVTKAYHFKDERMKDFFKQGVCFPEIYEVITGESLQKAYYE